jgi:hypothetical protein
MNLEDAIRKIVEEALAGRLNEDAPSSDPVVDDTAGAMVNALVQSLEDDDDIIASNAFEMMMGSMPDENRLMKVRLEDVEATAELVVQAIYRDPNLHYALKQIAKDLIESAAQAIQTDVPTPVGDA